MGGLAVNYYEARQRSDGSGWAWTGMNDGEVRTEPCCWTWPEGEPRTVDEATGPNPKPLGEPHSHATREEAERCFYDYELRHLREGRIRDDEQRRCEFVGADGVRCGRWTSAFLEAKHLMHLTFLCRAHRTPESVAAVHPFHPNIRISSSY